MTGVLRKFFDLLYDEDTITEEAFYRWKDNSDISEQTGKGVALRTVSQFFQWLQETDS